MTKDYGYPSFDLICKASSGDETSIKEILNFYDAYISKLCLRPFYHENGNYFTRFTILAMPGEKAELFAPKTNNGIRPKPNAVCLFSNPVSPLSLFK